MTLFGQTTSTPPPGGVTTPPPGGISSPPPATNPSNGGSAGAVTIDNPLAANSITEFFLLIIEILLVFAIPLIVLFIIYAGFLIVTAQGKEEQITQGKRALIYAVIGGLLILGAQLILEVIQGTVAALQNN